MIVFVSISDSVGMILIWVSETEKLQIGARWLRMCPIGKERNCASFNGVLSSKNALYGDLL